jgi:hypothetical protein
MPAARAPADSIGQGAGRRPFFDPSNFRSVKFLLIFKQFRATRL